MTRAPTALLLLVVAAAVVLFSPTISHEFLRYDDEIYIYDNPRIRPLSVANVAGVFGSGYYHAYIPVTLLSHMTDYALWGADPRGHHLTNVLLHALNAGLLFLLLLRVLRARGTPGTAERQPPPVQVLAGAAVGALAFALHPLRAESVAWVSDRKDLLMGAFLLGSVLCYIRGWLTPDVPAGARWRLASVLLFAGGTLSKSTAIVFPAALLAADIWWDRPFRDRRSLMLLVREKWPFLLVALAGAWAAAAAAGPARAHYAMEHLTGAGVWLFGLAMPAIVLLQMLWPARLVPVYFAPEAVRLVLPALLTAAVTLLAAMPWMRKRRPGALLLWVLFCLFLIPIIAGRDAGIQPLADRYTYLPGMVVGIAAALGGRWLAGARLRPARRVGGTLLAGGILLTWSLLTVRQNDVWRDSLTLWTHTITVAPETGVMALVPLGIARYYAGDTPGAITAAQDAIRLEPRYTEAYYLLGLARSAAADTAGAVTAFRAALERDPEKHAARIALGNLHVAGGRASEALAEYREVIRRQPGSPQAYYNLGLAFERLGAVDSATTAYGTAYRLHPGFPDPLINLGVLAQRNGNPGEAVRLLEQARRLDPGSAQVNYNLGVTLEQLGRGGEAVTAYRRALAAAPDMLDAILNLARLTALGGDLAGARELYHAAAGRAPQSPDPYFNLAVLALVAKDTSAARAWMDSAAVRGSDRAAAWLGAAAR